jgi:steroid 5-alpha reductase family enzyme
MQGIIPSILQAWAIVAGMMFILWLIQVRTKNAGFVDIGWSLGLLVAGIVYFKNVDGLPLRKTIILVLILLWAIRLIWLLVERLIKDPTEDKRYQKIRQDWKTQLNFKFFFFFQFQGLLDIVLSLPFLFIMLNPSPHVHAFEYLAILLWSIGFIGEGIADEQLRQFKNNPANKGKVCQAGVWNYSRHPNYFFEWLMWVAYCLFAFLSPWGWTSIIAPVLMYFFLMHVSGVPLAEAQSLKTRGEEYRRYQETTSMFIPWVKRT